MCKITRIIARGKEVEGEEAQRNKCDLDSGRNQLGGDRSCWETRRVKLLWKELNS